MENLKKFFWCLAAILLILTIFVGVFLRFYLIGKESFWFDEVFTLKVASSNLGQVFRGDVADPGFPPLYFIILNIWGGRLGLSEGASRSLSAVLSIATIPFIFLAAKSLSRDRLFALFSSAFFAVSHFSIIYAQEVRAYSLFVLLVAISLWIQNTIFFEDNPKKETFWLTIYFLVSLLGLYTHYLYFYLLFLQGIVWTIFIFFQKKTRNITFLIIGFFLIFEFFYLTWGTTHLIPAIFSKDSFYDIYRRSGYDFHQLQEPHFNRSFGYFAKQLFNNIYGFSGLKSVQLVIFIFFIFSFLSLIFILFQRKLVRSRVLLLWIPVVLTFFLGILTPFGQLFNQSYYYIFLLPYLCLFSAFLVSFLKFHFLGFLLGLSFLYLSLYSNYKYLKGLHKIQYREVASYLGNLSKKTEGEITVYFQGCDVKYVIQYYLEAGGDFNENKLFMICKDDPSSENEINFLVKRDQDGADAREFRLGIKFYGIQVWRRNLQKRIPGTRQ